MGHVYMRLEGLLQSYGDRSMWDVRDTLLIPTKSSIVGMLISALGIYDDMGVVSVSESILSMDVRVDHPGTIMNDYQTVRDSVKAGRKIESSGLATIKWREAGCVVHRRYLMGSSFRVVLTTMRSDEYNEALRNPIHPPFLGRKCCIPDAPIYMDALDADPEGAVWWRETTAGNGVMIRDEYMSYLYRSFLPRFMVSSQR